ncbi:hypothetical protein OsI_06602 [Oryza sativa Indica Group]|uniref:Uncharacterized protein n=1 Tax=Oryza sativa subsp. indica TaxID=39946 RepID=A2X320_ORYSI|nr:hypothetical protein OsI_06602 [Oryza sativa Indica Group]
MALVGGGKVVAAEPGVARRLWRVVRAVLYMLRRGLQAPSGRKLAMDLHLLLRRGKIAGKALGHLVTFHHHHHNHGHGFSASAAAAGSSSLSCRGIDPALAVEALMVTSSISKYVGLGDFVNLKICRPNLSEVLIGVGILGDDIWSFMSALEGV